MSGRCRVAAQSRGSENEKKTRGSGRGAIGESTGTVVESKPRGRPA